MQTVVEPRIERPCDVGPSVELGELTVSAGTRTLLENASARFGAGRVTLIIGGSGTGKSILLRILAGLLDESRPDIRVAGDVLFDGKRVAAGADGGLVCHTVFPE